MLCDLVSWGVHPRSVHVSDQLKSDVLFHLRCSPLILCTSVIFLILMSFQLECSPLILRIYGLTNPDAILAQDWSIHIDLFVSAPTTPTLVFSGVGVPHRCQSELLSRDPMIGSGVDPALQNILHYTKVVTGSFSTDPVGFALWGRISVRADALLVWFWFLLIFCLADLPDVRSIFISSRCIAYFIYLRFDVILADQPVVRFFTPNLPTPFGVENEVRCIGV